MQGPGPAMHHMIVMVDVEGFGNPRRTQVNHVKVREGLYRVLRETFGKSWGECWWESTGDGALVLARPSLPKSWFLEAVPQALAAALHRHNAAHPAEEEIRLRIVLHAGEVVFDDTGATSPAIILASRLLDARPLRTALARSPGALALITSAWFFEEVVRHSQNADPTSFRRVTVKVKETSTTAWINLPDQPFSPDLFDDERDKPAPDRHGMSMQSNVATGHGIVFAVQQGNQEVHSEQ